MNDGGDLFGTFRRDHRHLSAALDRRLQPMGDVLSRPATLDFDKTDDELLTMLWARTGPITPPRIVGAAKREVREINYYGRHGNRFTVVVEIDGDADLVRCWPDQIDAVRDFAADQPRQESGADAEAPSWNLSESQLVYRIEYLASLTESPPDIATLISQEIKRVTVIIDAITSQTATFTMSARERVREIVQNRRRAYEDAQAILDAIDLPAFSPPDLRIEEPDVDEGADDDAVTVQPFPPRLVVRDEDWATFLGVIRRWASVASRNSRSFMPLDEYALRDLLLATLHCVYPVALGEVMTAGSKSDIFVIPDPERPELKPIITELKIWDGPSDVAADLKQHLEQLTVRETRGALVYFFRRVSIEGPRARLLAAVEAAPGFQRWIVEGSDDTWAEAEFISHLGADRMVRITVIDVFLDKARVDGGKAVDEDPARQVRTRWSTTK